MGLFRSMVFTPQQEFRVGIPPHSLRTRGDAAGLPAPHDQDEAWGTEPEA